MLSVTMARGPVPLPAPAAEGRGSTPPTPAHQGSNPRRRRRGPPDPSAPDRGENGRAWPRCYRRAVRWKRAKPEPNPGAEPLSPSASSRVPGSGQPDHIDDPLDHLIDVHVTRVDLDGTGGGAQGGDLPGRVELVAPRQLDRYLDDCSPATDPSAERRLARTSGRAVRNTLTGASGKTTVPMSLPSTTAEPL